MIQVEAQLDAHESNAQLNSPGTSANATLPVVPGTHSGLCLTHDLEWLGYRDDMGLRGNPMAPSSIFVGNGLHTPPMPVMHDLAVTLPLSYWATASVPGPLSSFSGPVAPYRVLGPLHNHTTSN